MRIKIQGKTILPILLPIALLFSFTSLPDRVNFSGEWKLDESKSEFGQFGQFAARALKIAQSDNVMAVDRTIPSRDGGEGRTVSYTVSFDGKESESDGFGGSKRKTTASWSDDGQTLTLHHKTHFDRDGQGIDVESTETWTLSGDGLLTIMTHMSSPQGEIETKAVYSK